MVVVADVGAAIDIVVGILIHFLFDVNVGVYWWLWCCGGVIGVDVEVVGVGGVFLAFASSDHTARDQETGSNVLTNSGYEKDLGIGRQTVRN